MNSNICKMKKHLRKTFDFFKGYKKIFFVIFIFLLILVICISMALVYFLNKKLSEESINAASSTTSTTFIVTEGRSESEHFILTDQAIEGVQLK